MTNLEGKTVFETSWPMRAVAIQYNKDVHVAAENLVFRQCFHTGVSTSHGITNGIVVDHNGNIYAATGKVEKICSDGKATIIFAGHKDNATVYGLDITSCGNFICSGATDGTVCVWNKNGELISTFNLKSGGVDVTVFTVAFAPDSDGKIICSGSSDNTVRLWNVEAGKCISELSGHTNCVRSVAFSPDGKYVCSGSYDKTVRVWNTETGKCEHKLEHNGIVNIVAFSPDGKYMCSGTGVVPFIEHFDYYRPVQNGENTAAVHCTTSWEQLYILNTGHKEAVKDIAVSPEGKIYTASEDGKVMCFIPV